MRIRKHARNSGLSFAQASLDVPYTRSSLQAHVCELNRSPWDVMEFAPQSDLSYQYQFQVEGEDSVTANGSGGDSIGAVESVASLKISWDEEAKEDEENGRNLSSSVDDAAKREDEIEPKRKGGSFVSCNKTDGKRWKCRREAKEGHSLCEHHLLQLRSYHSYSYSSSRKSNKAVEKVAGSRRRARGRASSAANPLEFYYYSGFGPLWGKKRGGKEGGREMKNKEKVDDDAAARASPSSSSHTDEDDNDSNDSDHDEVHDDNEDDGDTGKKRVRKPVKARSLKSLM